MEKELRLQLHIALKNIETLQMRLDRWERECKELRAENDHLYQVKASLLKSLRESERTVRILVSQSAKETAK